MSVGIFADDTTRRIVKMGLEAIVSVHDPAISKAVAEVTVLAIEKGKKDTFVHSLEHL